MGRNGQWPSSASLPLHAYPVIACFLLGVARAQNQPFRSNDCSLNKICPIDSYIQYVQYSTSYVLYQGTVCTLLRVNCYILVRGTRYLFLMLNNNLNTHYHYCVLYISALLVF
jgi:hypothetical protein